MIEFEGEAAFSPSDYSEWCATVGVTCPDFIIQGPFDYNDPSGESTLDVEVLFATTPGATSVYWTDKSWMYDFALNLYADASKGASTCVWPVCARAACGLLGGRTHAGLWGRGTLSADVSLCVCLCLCVVQSRMWSRSPMAGRKMTSATSPRAPAPHSAGARRSMCPPPTRSS